MRCDGGRGLALARPVLRGICGVEDCNGVTYGDEVCPRCREEIDALVRMAAEDRERVSSAFVVNARKVAKRIGDFAWLMLFVALMSWLAVEMIPRLWLAYKVWEMGSN